MALLRKNDLILFQLKAQNCGSCFGGGVVLFNEDASDAKTRQLKTHLYDTITTSNSKLKWEPSRVPDPLPSTTTQISSLHLQIIF